MDASVGGGALSHIAGVLVTGQQDILAILVDNFRAVYQAGPVGPEGAFNDFM